MDVSDTQVLCSRLRVVLHRDTRHGPHVPRMDDHPTPRPSVSAHLPPDGRGASGGCASCAEERGTARVGVCVVQRRRRHLDRGPEARRARGECG